MDPRRSLDVLSLRISGRVERQIIERRISRLVERNSSLGAYAGLTRSSLMLSGISVLTSNVRAVNLVLPSLSATGIFAGIRTAIEVGVDLSRKMERKIRLISLSGPLSKRDYAAVHRLLTEELHLAERDWELVPAVGLSALAVHANDLWIATHWTTAHALDIRCRLGLLAPRQVVYLIQDYEPSFLPASTDAFVAASTYRAGFVPLVNSTPLAAALVRNAGLDVEVGQVFAPQLDLARLRQASVERPSHPRREVLFYGRPSKPRNMFNLGVSALRKVTATFSDASRWTFTSMGENHRPVMLTGGVRLQPLGALSWSGYFETLATAPVLLSLQASPHPSHPPLDMVVSGGLAVTNDVDSTRGGLHANLHVGNADPDALAEILIDLMTRVSSEAYCVNAFDSALVSKLGVPLRQALDSVSKKLNAG